MSSVASENDEMIDLDPFDSESIQNEEVKRKRRKRSNVWVFFEMVPDSENNDGKPRAKCKMCGVIYMAASKYGTGNMRRHIETCPRRSSRDIGQMMLSQNSGNISEFDTFRPDELSGYMKKSQLDLYLDEPRAERNAKIDILSFWKGNEFRYPDLARMARDILSVPVSTVASESTFSVGGRIIDQFRSALKADIVEALVCTRDWLYGEEQEIQEEVKLDELTEDVMELENNKGKGLEDAPPHSSSSRFV
ncbi:hypothetical protein F2P56_010765 [Juglans regia]|uniref:BED-type domain-containing protein n=1 Tax=Juglans regia TaxID=51240 RepID=A0A834CZ32_JUGRE|nr:hypothetical protein F2P56_010765 [Juglans regia]